MARLSGPSVHVAWLRTAARHLCKPDYLCDVYLHWGELGERYIAQFWTRQNVVVATLDVEGGSIDDLVDHLKVQMKVCGLC